MYHKEYMWFKSTPGFVAARRIIEWLHIHGHDAYLVGGCVRDTYLTGRDPKDYDVVTAALPERVEELFQGSTKAIGAKFGVIQVQNSPDGLILCQNDMINTEVATYRSDGAYSDNRRPDRVKFSDNLEEDIKRRDFTMNGLAYNPVDGELIDYVDGVRDIKSRLIRCIGNPQDRFGEDALRMLRAIRFAVQLDFQIEAATWKALCCQAYLAFHISQERVREELIKMLVSPDPARALYLMNQSGLLNVLFPSGIVNEFHRTLLKLQWGQQIEADYLTMLTIMSGHTMIASLDRFLSCLKLSAEEEKQIRNARSIATSLTATAPISRAALIRHLRTPGITVAMAYASTLEAIDGCLSNDHWDARLASLVNLNTPEIVDQKPFVTGNDLIARGIEPGPVYKTLLYQLETAQLNLEINNRSEALQWLDAHILTT